MTRFSSKLFVYQRVITIRRHYINHYSSLLTIMKVAVYVSLPDPYAPCTEYLPTFTTEVTQRYVNIPAPWSVGERRSPEISPINGFVVSDGQFLPYEPGVGERRCRRCRLCCGPAAVSVDTGTKGSARGAPGMFQATRRLIIGY